jgi:hypothetical protein
MEAGRVAISGAHVIAENTENWLSFRDPHSAIDWPRKGWLLEEPSLFEAEITGPTDGRCADDHVVQHLNLQESGAFGKSAS